MQKVPGKGENQLCAVYLGAKEEEKLSLRKGKRSRQLFASLTRTSTRLRWGCQEARRIPSRSFDFAFVSDSSCISVAFRQKFASTRDLLCFEKKTTAERFFQRSLTTKFSLITVTASLRVPHSSFLSLFCGRKSFPNPLDVVLY